MGCDHAGGAEQRIERKTIMGKYEVRADFGHRGEVRKSRSLAGAVVKGMLLSMKGAKETRIIKTPPTQEGAHEFRSTRLATLQLGYARLVSNGGEIVQFALKEHNVPTLTTNEALNGE